MQNNKSSMITKDGRRIWESAVIVSPEWLFEKNMCPPSGEEHATLKKTSVSFFMSRPLRADHTPQNELVWLSNAMSMFPSVEDTCLDFLTIDPLGQVEERYLLHAGDTFDVNNRYAREAQLPMPTERLQREHDVLRIDSTFLMNIAIDNVMAD